jgi:ABC-type antimicrobial peptide transport system permease subunit
MILGTGMLLTGIGMAIGIAVSFASSRVLASLLFGVGLGDILTTAAAVVILSAVAMFACYIPARPAARLDPVAALRQD